MRGERDTSVSSTRAGVEVLFGGGSQTVDYGLEEQERLRDDAVRAFFAENPTQNPGIVVHLRQASNSASVVDLKKRVTRLITTAANRNPDDHSGGLPLDFSGRTITYEVYTSSLKQERGLRRTAGLSAQHGHTEMAANTLTLADKEISLRTVLLAKFL